MSGTTSPNNHNPLEHVMENPVPFEEHESRPARIGTIIWGLVVVTLGSLLILTSQARLELDFTVTAMWLLLGAGAAMLIGGAVQLMRRK